MTVTKNASLLKHNTFGIEATAAAWVEYDSEDELRQLLTLAEEGQLPRPLLHVGAGSNLLFLADYAGTVLHSRIEGVEVLAETPEEVLVRVGSGMVFDRFVEYAVACGWHGLENLSLVPGEVGGAAVQNIGAYGVEAADFIERVEGVWLADGHRDEWPKTACDYSYRHSIFKSKLRAEIAVTAVTFRLSKVFSPRLDYGGLRKAMAEQGLDEARLSPQQLRELVISIRRSKLPDPQVLGNAGSFFMNPVVEAAAYERLLASYPAMPCYPLPDGRVKVPAAWLIERAGWKGRQMGPAAVHDRQALVLVNRGGATGRDILRLSDAVREAVRQQFGIDLQPEVNMIGSASL